MGDGPLTSRFWSGRRVLLTGHTGFKGAWTAVMLADLGAQLTGVSLDPPPGETSLWRLFDGRVPITEHAGDLRDAAFVADACRRARPEVVLHMAAQAQVLVGYIDPAATYATNVMGTVHLLEALRGVDPAVVLVVTSDKVYRHPAEGGRFVESSAIGGSDPYSASKAAAELVACSYAETVFAPRGVPLATARGGNVLGGGDFASHRLVPDILRAAREQRPVSLRYPDALRPWQHVLDCVTGYLLFAEHLHGRRTADPPALNFGPAVEEEMTVSQVAEAIGRRLGNPRPWALAPDNGRPEPPVLRLDASLAQGVLGWSPRLALPQTIDWTAEWYRAHLDGADPLALVRSQIARYRGLWPPTSDRSRPA